MRNRILNTIVLLFAFTSVLLGQEQASRIENSPFPVSSVPDKLIVFNTSGFSQSELFTTNTLQGLLAKSKPIIYRDHGGGYSKWLEDIENNTSVTIDKSFSNDFNGLIQHFKDSISGYVLCNLHDNSSNTAISICGILDAIAVTPEKVNLMNNLGIEMLEDIRSKDEQWALNQYRDQFNKQIITYQKEGADLFLGDYSVYTNAFHFFDNIESDMTNQAFSMMDESSMLFGWGDDEYKTVSKASSHSINVFPADWALNISTLSNFEAETKQKNHLGEVEVEDNVHTVCFVITDGDNLQWMLNDFGTNQRWFASPDRGKVDLGWTISPALCELAPTVMKYFYDRASDSENGRDYFIAGPSGIGYNYPSQFPAKTKMSELLNEYMEKSDLNIVNVIDNPANLDAVKPCLEQEAIDGIFLYTYGDHYTGLNGSIQWHNNKPVIGARYALWEGAYSPQSLATRLNSMPRNPKSASGYSLITVHAWSMTVSDVKYCANMLNQNVRVVAPDEFVKLIQANLSDPTTDSEIFESGGNEIELSQNFPNPASSATTIRYYLPKKANNVIFSIYTIKGQLIQEKKISNQIPGWHDFKLSTNEFKPGTYLYKLNMDDGRIQSSSKLMVVK